jgi:hypothetical protein
VITTGAGGGARAALSAVIAVFSIALGMLHGWGFDYACVNLVTIFKRCRRSG